MATPVETVIKKVPHIYSPEEKAKLNESFLRLQDERDEVELEKKVAMARFKERLASIDNQSKTMRNNLNTGTEVREHVCSVLRDKDRRMVSFVDTTSGETVLETKFTRNDWDIVMGNNHPQPGLFDATSYGADMPTLPPLRPDSDENGNVIAGPNTDLYNLTYPESPFQKLSQHIEFVVQFRSIGYDDFDAEMQVYYNQVVDQLAHYDRAQLVEALPVFDANEKDGQPIDEAHQRVHGVLVAYIKERLALLDRTPADEAITPLAEPSFLEHNLKAFEQQAAEDDGAEREAGHGDEIDEELEDSDGEDEQPTTGSKKPRKPKTPTRPAKKMPGHVK